jgi:cell division protein FtsW
MSVGALVLRGPFARRGKARSRRRSSPEYNLMLTATLCLLAFGAVMVYSASSTTQVLANGDLSNSVYFLKRTVIFGAAGLLIMHLMAHHGLRLIRLLTPALVAISFLLLVAVLGIGNSVNGATRWIGSGFLQVQPSELAKVTLVLYGAHLLAAKPKRARTIPEMAPYLLVTGLACLLMMAQPDLGTALVTTFAVSTVLIAAGARIRDLLLIAAVIGFLVLVAILVEPYRRERLFGFLNPGADAAGSGFQAVQAKIALGSGGLTGVGVGNGVQKAFYLPEAHTDMIAAVIGEELGFVGIAALVGLFGMFGYAGFRIAQKAKDRYGKLLAAGLTSAVLVQAVINLYAAMGLAPLTGVPLPFVSYGNSSLLVSLAAVGLILNVASGGTAATAARRPPQRKPRASSRAGKLRVVEGGRSAARGRSRSGQRKSRHSGGGNGRARRAGNSRRRRASG